MAVVLTPKLDAINTMLSVIAESPVTALGENQDAIQAEFILDETNRRIQAQGWHFNTYQQDMTVDAFGKIPVGTSNSRLDWPRTCEDDPDLVLRYNASTGVPEVYDRRHNVDTFEVGRIFKNVTCVQLLDFDRIPQVARDYIMISAARVFQARNLGSGVRDRFSESDEFRARAMMRLEDSRTGDYSIATGRLSQAIRRRNSPRRIGY